MSTTGRVSPNRRGRGRGGWLWYVVGIGLIGFALLSLARSVREAPARQLRAELAGVGTVLVTVQLTPDPPKVGTILVRIEITDARGIGTAVDASATLVSSVSGSRTDIALQRIAQGAFQGIVLFPSVGAWWLDVELASRQARTRVRFPVRVAASI